MSYFLNSKLCPEIAHYILHRDFGDLPLDMLPDNWLSNAIGEHFLELFFPKLPPVPEEADQDDLDTVTPSYGDPDDILTKMLLGDVEGIIKDISVTSAPYRIIHMDNGIVVFPCILIDTQGVF